MTTPNSPTRRRRTVLILVMVLAVLAVVFVIGAHLFWIAEDGCKNESGQKAEALTTLPDISARLPRSERQAVSRYFSMLQAKSEGRKDAVSRYPADEMRTVSADPLDDSDEGNPHRLAFSSIKILQTSHRGSSTRLTVRFDEQSWVCPGTTYAGCSTPPSHGAQSEADDLYHRLTFEKTTVTDTNPTGLKLVADSEFDPQTEIESGTVTCPVPWFDLWDRTAAMSR